MERAESSRSYVSPEVVRALATSSDSSLTSAKKKNATVQKSAMSNHESDTHTYIKTRRNYDGSRISSASHTVPNVGRRKAHQLQSNTRGKSSLDHQKNAKKAGVDQMAFARILCADACFDAAVGVRVRTCSARRPPGRFSPFPPPALCSSLYAAGRMSTWSCQT